MRPSLSAFSLDGIVVLWAITMNIVVERSSDDDYSSSSSSSCSGENIIYKQKKFWVIDFNRNESLKAQMEEADEDVALARLSNLNW